MVLLMVSNLLNISIPIFLQCNQLDECIMRRVKTVVNINGEFCDIYTIMESHD